jgi:hypothetical protein
VTEDEMGRYVARMGKREIRIGYCWKARRKEPLGRPRYRWTNNIRMNVVEVGWGDVNWFGLAQDRDNCEFDNEP